LLHNEKVNTNIIINFTTTIFTRGGNGNGGGRPCWPPPCVPINNGISLLLLTGLFLVIYRSKNNK
jgi:hypothetical protein